MKACFKQSLMALLMSACLVLTACVHHSPQATRTTPSLKAGKASFQKQDYKAAFAALYPFALKGNSDAAYAVGYMLYYGKTGVKNETEGLNWIRQAAEEGNSQAEQALGILLARANTSSL